MNKILAYLLSAIVVFSGLTYIYNNHLETVVTQSNQRIIAEYNTKIIALQNKIDLETIKLEAKVKDITDAKQIEINALSANYESVIASLRKRPNRPTSTSNLNSSTCTTEGKTGAYPAELFAEDAKDFIDFARDSEELRLNLIQCYKQYDEVKNAIETISK